MRHISARTIRTIVRQACIVLVAVVFVATQTAAALTPQERLQKAFRGISFVDAPCAAEEFSEGSGVDTSAAEKANAQKVIGIAKTMDLDKEGALIGLITALVESGLKNYANNGTYVDADENYSGTRLGEISQSLPHDAVGNDHDSVGIMQQRVTGGWAGLGSSYDNLNNPEVIKRLMTPAFAAQAFFEKMVAVVPDWRGKEPGLVAQTVQVSAYPGRYRDRISDASALIDELWDISPAIPLLIPSGTVVSSDVAATDCYKSGKEAIYNTIMKFAWPRYNDTRSKGNAEGIDGCVGNCVRKGDYTTAVINSSYVGGCQGVDCGAFVTIVMRESGADPEYNRNPECNTRCQRDYLRRNSGDGGKKYTRVTSEADLLPVDMVIAIRDDGDFGGLIGHTFIYIGDALNGRQDDTGVEWSGVTASASFCGRAPMASGMDNFKEYEWYRLN